MKVSPMDGQFSGVKPEFRQLHKRLPCIIAVALIGRLLFVWLRDFGFPRCPETWGGEMTSVAVALAQGEGFSSPYWTPTGPTALVPPVYPFVLSLIFRVVGIHEVSAGYVALALNAGLSALVCVPLFLMGRRMFGHTVAIVATWLWAIYPVTGYSDSILIWNTSLYTLLLATVVAWFLCINVMDGIWRWVGLGVLAGFTVLTEPISLSVVPMFLAWLYFAGRADVRKVLGASLAVVVVITPWLVRNYQTFDRPVFIRSGLGLQLSCGIHTDPFIVSKAKCKLPGRDGTETAKYASQGEIRYMREKLSESLVWIQNHPEQFARKTFRRFVAFWVGNRDLAWMYWPHSRIMNFKRAVYTAPVLLALLGLFIMRRNRVGGVVAFLSIFFLYPDIHYLSPSQPRYRFPIEPSLFVLSAYAMNTVWNSAARKIVSRHSI